MVVADEIFMVFHPLENYARIPGFRDTAFGISYFGVPEAVPESRMLFLGARASGLCCGLGQEEFLLPQEGSGFRLAAQTPPNRLNFAQHLRLIRERGTHI